MRRKSSEPRQKITDDMRAILIFGTDFFSGGKCPWTISLGTSRFKDAKLPAKLRREMAATWNELRDSILREKPNAWAKIFDSN